MVAKKRKIVKTNKKIEVQELDPTLEKPVYFSSQNIYHEWNIIYQSFKSSNISPELFKDKGLKFMQRVSQDYLRLYEQLCHTNLKELKSKEMHDFKDNIVLMWNKFNSLLYSDRGEEGKDRISSLISKAEQKISKEEAKIADAFYSLISEIKKFYNFNQPIQRDSSVKSSIGQKKPKARSPEVHQEESMVAKIKARSKNRDSRQCNSK